MTEFPFAMPDRRLSDAIHADLKRFTAQWRRDNTIGSHEPIDAFCDVMLRGGKRLRGILAMQSYYAHGGQDDATALGAARVFEIIQTSLLLVDDIADRSTLRRGGPSAHTRLEAYARTTNMKGSARHYGEVQTMNVAYAGLHKATIELLDLAVSPEIARHVCKRFHENIAMTINGQIDDIYNEATNELVSEAMVESVLERKAAYYTILSPIELGAFLAGATELPPSLHEYSLHTGCAFQIADDIISTFGIEDETGKGSNDDIREGKLTLLTHYGLENGTAMQQRSLRAILGKADATTQECDMVRMLLQEIGALEYVRAQLRMHKRRAIAVLESNDETDSKFIQYLITLTDYVAQRRA